MLYLSIIFLLHVVAVVTSSNSCLIQTCPASRGGDIVAAIYNTSAPDTGGQDDVAAVANFLTLNCGLSPRITQCYVDCHGIYGENGAYWTVQNCRSQCGIVAPLVNCFGYYAWFCSLAVSNVCQLATPSTPTTNPTATTTTTSQSNPSSASKQSNLGAIITGSSVGGASGLLLLVLLVCCLYLRKNGEAVARNYSSGSMRSGYGGGDGHSRGGSEGGHSGGGHEGGHQLSNSNYFTPPPPDPPSRVDYSSNTGFRSNPDDASQEQLYGNPEWQATKTDRQHVTVIDWD